MPARSCLNWLIGKVLLKRYKVENQPKFDQNSKNFRLEFKPYKLKEVIQQLGDENLAYYFLQLRNLDYLLGRVIEVNEGKILRKFRQDHAKFQEPRNRLARARTSDLTRAADVHELLQNHPKSHPNFD